REDRRGGREDGRGNRSSVTTVLSNLSPGEKKKLLASTLLLPRRTWVAPQPKSIRTNCWSTLPCVFTLLP
ncbi:hypothetical protein KUCAC02_011763, partial [Chaenocephalus aceratus]